MEKIVDTPRWRQNGRWQWQWQWQWVEVEDLVGRRDGGVSAHQPRTTAVSQNGSGMVPWIDSMEAAARHPLHPMPLPNKATLLSALPTRAIYHRPRPPRKLFSLLMFCCFSFAMTGKALLAEQRQTGVTASHFSGHPVYQASFSPAPCRRHCQTRCRPTLRRRRTSQMARHATCPSL